MKSYIKEKVAYTLEEIRDRMGLELRVSKRHGVCFMPIETTEASSPIPVPIPIVKPEHNIFPEPEPVVATVLEVKPKRVNKTKYPVDSIEAFMQRYEERTGHTE